MQANTEMPKEILTKLERYKRYFVFIMLLCVPSFTTAKSVDWQYMGHGYSHSKTIGDTNGVSYYIKRSSIKYTRLTYKGEKNRYRTALTKMVLDKPVYADGKQLTILKEVMFFDCNTHKSIVHTVAGFVDDHSHYVTSSIIHPRREQMPFISHPHGSVGYKTIVAVCEAAL